MQSRYGDGNAGENANLLIEFLVVFCLMCRLGFPGNLASVFGGRTVLLGIDYGSSMLQVVLMLLTSGDTFLDIKLLDFKKKYAVIYLMLALMFTISLLVSANRTKQLTIILRFSITALFGLWLADRYDPQQLLELMYLAQIGIVFANLLTLTVFRGAGYLVDEGYVYTFRGLYTQKNGLGSAFAYGIALQYALYRMKKAKKRPISLGFFCVFAAQLFFLFYSKATTAIFTCFVPIVYLWMYDKLGKKELRFQWGIVYAVVSIGFIVFALTVLPLFAPLLEAIGKDATLSNRVPMWKTIIAFMQKSHSFTGYGLLQFWETPTALKSLQGMFDRNSWYRSMSFGAHNTLLEMWLDVGLIGAAAYLFTIFCCFHDVRALTKEQYELCAVLMIPYLISGLTDRHYTNANYATMFFFVMLGVACSRETATAAVRPDRRREAPESARAASHTAGRDNP
ncbi:MAG: O-antigen ligase family protein [Oscillospiraceae bacterium]|nr:O-antigen ligase family protein [Oscillospiraceae bacterium]